MTLSTTGSMTEASNEDDFLLLLFCAPYVSAFHPYQAQNEPQHANGHSTD